VARVPAHVTRTATCRSSTDRVLREAYRPTVFRESTRAPPAQLQRGGELSSRCRAFCSSSRPKKEKDMTAATYWAPLLAVFAACANPSTSAPPASVASTSAASPGVDSIADAACSWAPVPQCTTGRYSLSCKGSNGGGAFCVSDDATRCPGPDPAPGAVTYASCENECAAGEYGVACGSPGPVASSARPPAGCHTVKVTPGGALYYCCPCR
jgi:hypothetical protein